MSKKKVQNGIIYINSLYHAKISRSEPASDKLFNAALAIKGVLRQTTQLNGQIVDGRVRPSAAYDPTNISQQQAMARIHLFARAALDDPEVKAYMMATIQKTRSPRTMKWLNASEERRSDWDFRVDNGDAHIFFEMIVNVWLNLATEAKPLGPDFQKFCVD